MTQPQPEHKSDKQKLANGLDHQTGSEPTPVVGSLLLEQLGDSQFSVAKALGGVQGTLEALLPTLVFVVLYPIIGSLFWPLACSLAIAVGFIAFRIITRSSKFSQVFFGILVTLLGAFWAWKSGRAENFFALGFWTNGVYGILVFLTILAKVPVIGWIIAMALGKSKEWRQPEHRVFYRNSLLATWSLVVLFIVRLLVELPLYYLDLLMPLGIARIILGVPAFAIVVWLTWRLMRQPVQQLKESSTKNL